VTALLDTHTFLWWVTNDTRRLSRRVIRTLEDPDNRIFFSAASAMEIAILAAEDSQVSKGRRLEIRWPDAPDRYVEEQLHVNGFDRLPILVRHALHVYALPWHHHDPFDRLLIAQSHLEGMPLLSADSAFDRYPVQVIW
jgi:PIN domain nuclease of toxin-antitoxin system